MKFYFLAFYLSLTFVLTLKAQNETEKKHLKIILETIAQQHDVKFNYIEEEIESFMIEPLQEKMTLKEKLLLISKQTQLRFEFITSQYISVVNNQKIDQSYCGFILDFDTKMPIEEATIVVTNSSYFCVSNSNGRFELTTKVINPINISHVNYESVQIDFDHFMASDCAPVFLKRKENMLNDVFLEVYLAQGISKKRDGSFEMLPKKVGLFPGLTEPDVFQTMQQIPGINTPDEKISNMSVRGGTHDQNLVLWNGIRLFQTGHFFGLISSLNPHLAHKINVLKNGTSPFYSEGVSSVVSISTHTNDIQENEGAFGLNMINSDFYSKIKLSKKANFEISGRRSTTDFLNSPTYEGYFDRVFQNTVITNFTDNQNTQYQASESFYFYDFTAQYHQKIKKETDLYIDLINISNVLDVAQSKTENNLTFFGESELEQKTLGLNVLLQTKWNSKWKSEYSGYYSNYIINATQATLLNNQNLTQENNVLDTGFSFKNMHKINENFTFSNGYQFNEIGIRNSDAVNTPVFSRRIKEVIKSHAIIASLDFKSDQLPWSGFIGFRQNYVESFKKFIFEPRALLRYQFNPHFNTVLMGESKHQVTSQIIDLQQDFLGIEKRRWILSNNQDRPIIQSRQISLEFVLNQNNWLFSVEHFYKHVSGITTMSQGFQNQFEFVNASGQYEVMGSECLIQKQLSFLTAWISYTFQENNYEFNTLSTPVFPNNLEIRHAIKNAFIFKINRLQLSVGSQWFTGKPNTSLRSNTPVFTSPETPTIQYQSPNASRLENYFQMNLSSAYAFSFKNDSRLKIGFSVQNLLNNRINLHQNYRINRVNNLVEQVNTFSLERTPNAFLRFEF